MFSRKMMPLEHAIIGYIAFSIFVHVVYREPPTSMEAIIVILASILPDLIDKPLAWEFGFFTSGRAIAHSIFFAIPLVIAVFLIAKRREKTRLGLAFGIGYLLHLPADVIPTYLMEGEVRIDRIMWPLREESDGYDAGFREEFVGNIGSYLTWLSEQIASGNPDPAVFVLGALITFGILLWAYDGMPVARDIYVIGRRSLRKLVSTAENRIL